MIHLQDRSWIKINPSPELKKNRRWSESTSNSDQTQSSSIDGFWSQKVFFPTRCPDSNGSINVSRRSRVFSEIKSHWSKNFHPKTWSMFCRTRLVISGFLICHWRTLACFFPYWGLFQQSEIFFFSGGLMGLSAAQSFCFTSLPYCQLPTS